MWKEHVMNTRKISLTVLILLHMWLISTAAYAEESSVQSLTITVQIGTETQSIDLEESRFLSLEDNIRQTLEYLYKNSEEEVTVLFIDEKPPEETEYEALIEELQEEKLQQEEQSEMDLEEDSMINIDDEKNIVPEEPVEDTAHEITLQIDGTDAIQNKVYEKGGEVLVPFRDIWEYVGGGVGYQKNDTLGLFVIWGIQNGVKTEICIGDRRAFRNGELFYMDRSPEIVDGTTYIELEYIQQFIGSKVEYDRKTKTAKITTKIQN